MSAEKGPVDPVRGFNVEPFWFAARHVVVERMVRRPVDEAVGRAVVEMVSDEAEALNSEGERTATPAVHLRLEPSAYELLRGSVSEWTQYVAKIKTQDRVGQGVWDKIAVPILDQIEHPAGEDHE